MMAPVPSTRRDSRIDATIPLANPVKGRDGKMIHEITIPKDTAILICTSIPGAVRLYQAHFLLSDFELEHFGRHLGSGCCGVQVGFRKDSLGLD
jgi:hypothetical protein